MGAGRAGARAPEQRSGWMRGDTLREGIRPERLRPTIATALPARIQTLRNKPHCERMTSRRRDRFGLKSPAGHRTLQYHLRYCIFRHEVSRRYLGHGCRDSQ
jgi:hypothetical protein